MPFPIRRRRRVALLSSALMAAALLMPTGALASTKSYWFTGNYSVDNQYVSAYATWTFYKIDGSSTNVFVEVQGTAKAKAPYSLLRFEPWLMRSAGSTTLGNWRPNQTLTVNDGQAIHLELTYSGATVSTDFYASTQTYTPYVRPDMYSVEWSGNKSQQVAVANNAVERWYNAAFPMSIAICGKVLYYAIRTEYWFGACGNRTH